ncbi:response regulator [candidate division KSB1 bacterium]|nr:response regulator [candidate division KSB1 bacterium]
MKGNNKVSKILIVDDARLMRNIIKSVLVNEGDVEIIEARNGQQAVECYKEFQPDVVTMDITMDEMNGVEATRAIIAYDPYAVIIVVTSLRQEKLFKQCLAAGAKDYIIKPFTKERVRSAILKSLESCSRVW